MLSDKVSCSFLISVQNCFESLVRFGLIFCRLTLATSFLRVLHALVKFTQFKAFFSFRYFFLNHLFLQFLIFMILAVTISDGFFWQTVLDLTNLFKVLNKQLLWSYILILRHLIRTLWAMYLVETLKTYSLLSCQNSSFLA